MATTLNTLNNLSTTGSITLSNSIYANTNLSSGSWNISVSEELTDFFELVLAKKHFPITYYNFWLKSE